MSDAVGRSAHGFLLARDAQKALEALSGRLGKPINQLIDIDDLPQPRSAQEHLELAVVCHYLFERLEDAEQAYRNCLVSEPNCRLALLGLVGRLLYTFSHDE